MNLQNGYKVIYEKTSEGKRAFYASKTGLFADAELITEATIGEYKLIYEKNGRFYGSTTGLPTDNDYCFEAFNKVFVEGYEEPAAATYTRRSRKATPVVEEEPVVEDTEVSVE